MEANEYDTDVLLPPRKRLLAGLKRQNSESPSQSSLENSSPSPSPNPSPLSEFDSRLQNLLKSYKNGPQMSPEEIAKAARSAAAAAAKAAESARAAAEEKAVIAGKAVTAAKTALSLVACFPNDGQSRKNKMKKHVPVEFLYKEQQVVENCKTTTDEELARKLHRAINSSPRISKPPPSPNHKKPKQSLEDDSMQEDADTEGSYVDEAIFESESSDGIMHINGRKRGRVKQKKLSLSLCSFKDRVNPKDGQNENSSDPIRSVSPIEPAPSWKCQDFKAPQCIETNKVVQS